MLGTSVVVPSTSNFGMLLMAEFRELAAEHTLDGVSLGNKAGPFEAVIAASSYARVAMG